MKLFADYSVQFLSDGTDTLEFDLSDAPLNLEGDPSALAPDPQFSPISKVPAAPFMKSCTLEGTTLTATFAGPLPENDISQQTAKYKLAFTLIF